MWGTRAKITSEDWSRAGQEVRVLGRVGVGGGGLAGSSSRVAEGGLEGRWVGWD